MGTELATLCLVNAVHLTTLSLACSGGVFVHLKISKITWLHVSTRTWCILFADCKATLSDFRIRFNIMGSTTIFEVTQDILSIVIITRIIHTWSWSVAWSSIIKSLFAWRPCCSFRILNGRKRIYP